MRDKGRETWISWLIRRCTMGFLLPLVVVSCRGGPPPDTDGKKVLMLMSPGFGVNYFLNRDVFEQYGWKIIVAGLNETIPPCRSFAEPMGARPLVADVLVSQIEDISEYDALAIMPATQFDPDLDPLADVLHDEQAMRLVSRAAESGIPVFTLCAGVRVLAEAGLLGGKRVTGSPKYQEVYQEAGATYVGNDHPPVIDGSIVTGVRDLYYNVANCQALATAMEMKDDRGPHEEIHDWSLETNPADLDGEELVWAKTYGGRGPDGGRALCDAEDGGFLLVGYTFSHGSGDADILAIRVDSDARLLWQESYGGRGTEYGHGCTRTSDGFLITGYTTSFGAGGKDAFVVKIDPAGREVWSKAYGGASWDVGVSACETDDGYGVCGFTHSRGEGEEDVYLVKIDKEGNEAWSKTYGGRRSEMGGSIMVMEDGGFLLGATTGTFGGGNCDLYLIRTDAEGGEIWTRTHHAEMRKGRGFDWANGMIGTRDGRFVIVGSSDTNDLMDTYVLEVDESGDPSWWNAFGDVFYDYGQSVSEMGDGGFIVGGVTKGLDDDNDIHVARLDAGGKILWQKTIGGPGSDWAHAVLASDSGEIVVLGQTRSRDTSDIDVLLLKLKDAIMPGDPMSALVRFRP